MIPSCTEEKLRLWEPDDAVERMARELRCSSFLASLLWMRGVEPDKAAAEKAWWVSPELEYWMEHVDLGRDSSRACAVWSSLPEGANVVVYGDYDVDGIAATTFMMDLALNRGSRVRYYIPHRNNQGYGFHPDVVDTIAKSGCKCDLLVVVDCGTQNIDAAERAKAHGIPVLIFDHHLARDEVAGADALVNPHIDGNDLARKLCAAGVVWSWAWKNELAPKDWLLKNLDVAALATIADCVSMDSPVNRAIVRRGVQAIRTQPRPGLSALMRGMELDTASLDCDALAMKIIPCLNAAGRLQLADLSMKIFFPSGDVDEHARKLVALNKKRRDLSAKIIGDVERSAREGSKYNHVLFGEDWPPGVLSSVASHICATRDAPVVLAAPTRKDTIRGTLRVPSGVDAEAILTAMSDDLLSWGGHRMAAGFSVETERWAEIRDRLEESLSNAKIEVEKEDALNWAPSQLDMMAWKDAERLGPFGVGNPYPRLFCPNEGGICAEPLGRKGSHIKIYVDGCELLGFGGEHLVTSGCRPSGWIYKPRINYWRSSENLQLVVEKVVTPEPQPGANEK
ncbi:DHH family phosphoesterase [Synergistaceae bacterium OttesenSCG-928-I11]|nr:DHH family phosphoesterase [Synergistaceae bacterium OttesenSCG-928-I11]